MFSMIPSSEKNLCEISKRQQVNERLEYTAHSISNPYFLQNDHVSNVLDTFWRYIYGAIIKSNLRAIKNYTLSYPTAQCIHCAVICNNSNLAVIDIVVSLYLEYFLNSFNGHTRCLRFLYHGLTFVWLRLVSQNQSDNARLLWIKSNFHQINVSLSFLLSLPSGC